MSLRVLYVINGLGTGGAERSLAELLPGIVDAGVEPSVAFLYRRSEGVEGDVERLGVPLRHVAAARLTSRVAALRRFVAEQRPHLVHATLFEAGLVARFASSRRVRLLESLVNTTYDPVRRGDPAVRPMKLSAIRHVDAWTARRYVTHFHAITPTVKRHAVATLGVRPDHVTVIERGRDPSRLGAPSVERRRRARVTLGLGAGDEVVVSVGRQEFQKGHRFLLEAVATLVPDRPRLVVLVAGRSGAATVELGQQARGPRLEGRIRFLGHRDDLPEVLAAGDLFAFPSLYEGLGGSVLEAMALGVPVVASDLPALRDVLDAGHDAVLVPPGQPGPLAMAMAELLDDPIRARRLGERARQSFLDRFTSSRSTERMLDLYDRLVPNGRQVVVR
ncbi:MAG: glycosyltransferase family 4 protein [Acidimicrobiales bacterium]